jgi:hypothetical protein
MVLQSLKHVQMVTTVRLVPLLEQHVQQERTLQRLQLVLSQRNNVICVHQVSIA